MPRTSFIVTDLSDYSWGNFLSALSAIIAQMTNNLNFPDPPYPISGIVSKLAELEVYTNKTSDQLSAIDREIRDKIRRELVMRISINGLYITMTAPGDAVKQNSSGYPSAKTREEYNESPGKPGNVRVRQGNHSGEVIFNCDKKPGTRSLEIQYQLDEPGAPVLTVVSTSSRGLKIQGLTPGRYYIFRVRAIGKRNVKPSDWSDYTGLFVA